ncbi:MAG: regulatory protein RecX [Hungatella sp.]|jgi:regulatory protein|nr:regulatory protein RecX [Hungatella sp.]
MRIISVTPLDKRRSKVLTDEDFAFALYRGELRAYNIEEGSQLSLEVYQEILEKILFKRAKERTLYLLRSRDRTELEIRRKLKDGYYPQEAIDYAVDFLKRYRFVDDENYGRNYISTYGDKKSRKQLEFELQNKGLDREEIDRLLEECQVSEEQQIAKFLKKKGYEKDITQPKERAKLAAALARKGFSYDAIYQVMECSDGSF